MIEELSLFMWVGLALNQFIAWNHTLLKFYSAHAVKTVGFLTV